MTDGASPISPPSVDASVLAAGQPVGGQQTIWPYPGNQQPLTNVYLCLPFKMSAGFVGQRTANKLFFLAAQDWTYGKQGGNGFFGLGQGDGAYPPSYFYLYFGHNSGNLDNSHACAFDLGLVCNPNVATTRLFPDVWYEIEVYIIASSTTTARNSSVLWWVNGALQGRYTNLNYIDGIVNQWQLNHTWDGGGAVQCGPPTNPANPNGRDCRIDQIYYFDHVKIASVLGLQAGSSAGSAPGPTPPSPTPPSPTPPSPTPPSPTPPPPTGTPGTVSNLTVVPQSSTTALVSFTQQDDGTGSPAKYDNRLAVSPISWGAASSIASGPCASAFAPSGIVGSTVTCLLSGLTPGQSYQLQNVALRGTMNQGATYGALGNVASNVPVITNFAPASGVSGVSVTITGSNFGATIGANTVKCNGQTATVTAASPTSLTVIAPDGVTTGKISVQTDQGIVYSEQNFTVGATDNGCGCS
jgi:hypothetical protein